jgi:hypothetical protein
MALEPVNRTALGAALKAGVDALSLNQTIEFTLYRRYVLPLDGYVYWVKDATAPTLKVMGSLHYSSVLQQQTDNTQPLSRVIFTAENPVRDFAEIDPQTLYMATFEGVQFAFSTLAEHYQQANLWHYVGNGNFSEYANLVVDDVSQLPTERNISNSLPSWLEMQNWGQTAWPDNPPFPTNPPWPVLIPFPAIPLYPAFLSPMNLHPPYGTISIEPDQTTAYAQAPTFKPNLSSDQLAHDRVIITFYGVTDRQVQDFIAAVNQYSLDTARIGIVGPIAIARDDQKATVPETLLLAEKKRVIFEVSYLQSVQRDIAQQMIEEVIVHVIGVDDFVAEVPSP